VSSGGALLSSGEGAGNRVEDAVTRLTAPVSLGRAPLCEDKDALSGHRDAVPRDKGAPPLVTDASRRRTENLNVSPSPALSLRRAKHDTRRVGRAWWVPSGRRVRCVPSADARKADQTAALEGAGASGHACVERDPRGPQHFRVVLGGGPSMTRVRDSSRRKYGRIRAHADCAHRSCRVHSSSTTVVSTLVPLTRAARPCPAASARCSGTPARGRPSSCGTARSSSS
jgi:hypothetical protein